MPDRLIDYSDMLEMYEKVMGEEEPDQVVWRFKKISAHQGPLRSDDPDYKGCSYNVKVDWEDGSSTYEPLNLIAETSSEVLAIYARNNNLLDTPGWKQFRKIAKNKKKNWRLLKQAKLKSYRTAVVYQYGFKVPRTADEAIRFDQENGNTRWQDAMALEMSQLKEYGTFKNLGKGGEPPPNFKKIRVHFVFAVKHDGRHKARLVAGGHLTEPPVDSIFSGVVSLRSLRTVMFIAELNGLQIWGADVGNAYLEAMTKERVYIVAGRGFGELEGCTLVIVKALYGLRSSGLRWHERFADTLRLMGFTPSKADGDVWMRRVDDHYEYIAVYVDDLAIASKDPGAIVEELKSRFGYKLKGVGPLEFHLGCNFGRDKDGTAYFGPIKYIEKMIAAFEKMFGHLPQKKSSPLDKNDHPEMDESPVLGPEDKTKYQSMIGALQWVISLGRFDIATAVMTMGRFRVEPREGHLERLKQIYGYLRKNNDGLIRVRTGEPDWSHLPEQNHDWMYSVYGDVVEEIPEDMPTPLGRRVVTTTYVDANLYHDQITGRAVTGVLHFINGMPVEWFSKRQATVETATYGSEFVAARIATDHIIDLRISLRYLGVPVHGPSYMFGDNASVVTSSTRPESSLNKRHNALAYHRVREAIAGKILKFFHIKGTDNPADVLSKHCGYHDAFGILKPLLFWRGLVGTEDRSEATEVGESHACSQPSVIQELITQFLWSRTGSMTDPSGG